MEVRATGDLFQHRYYRINTMILKWSGQWPYQTIRTRSILYVGIVLLGISQLIPEIMAVVKHLDDPDFLFKCVTPMILGGFCLIKFFFSALNSNKILMLLNRMRTDWDVLARDRDVNTLHEYAKEGRKIMILGTDLSMLRTAGAFTACFLFEIQPIVPKIIDILLENGTEPGEFPIPVDYLIIDEQKHYFYIVLHQFMVASMTFMIVAAHDGFMAICIHHACGLFAALGRKLERFGKTKTHEIGNGLGKPGMDFDDVASSIDWHNDAIEYAELIEATYSSCLFFSLGFQIFLITLTGLQVVTTKMKPHENLRFIVNNVATTIHLYAECYIAQLMTDQSISIRYRVLSSEWYKLPLKVQKSLLLMIMRCNVPCTMTAGKVSAISIETFGVVMKTSLSYFTVLRSL